MCINCVLGKLCEADLCKRFNEESTQERIESVKGTIQIANKVVSY